MVLVVAELALVLQSSMPATGGQQLTARTGMAAIFSLANIDLYRIPVDGYFANRSNNNPFLHTWSLSVEEQFYLIFPVLLLWLTRRPRPGQVDRRRRRMVIGIALCSVVSLLACLAMGEGFLGQVPGISSPTSFAFYAPITRAWEFGIGALALVLVRKPRESGNNVLFGAGLALIIGSALLLSPTTVFPGFATIWPVLGTALVLISAHRGVGDRLLGWAPMVWLGDLSYSLYLWHWPFIVFAPIVAPRLDSAELVAAILSVVPAWLSWRFLETPIRTRQLLSRARWVVASGLGVPMLLLVVLLVGAQHSWGNATTRARAADLESTTYGQDHGCFEPLPLAADALTKCTFNPAGSKTLFLVGDSHTDALSDGVLEAASELGYRVTITGAGSCTFIFGFELAADVPNEIGWCAPGSPTTTRT